MWQEWWCVLADTVGNWDDFDWGWKADGQEVETEETSLQCWLQDCRISMSPVGDLIAVASDDRIVHFTRELTTHSLMTQA